MEKRIILQSIEPLLRNNYALKLIWNELVQTQIGKKKKNHSVWEYKFRPVVSASALVWFIWHFVIEIYSS